jgi:hypothetical protein
MSLHEKGSAMLAKAKARRPYLRNKSTYQLEKYRLGDDSVAEYVFQVILAMVGFAAGLVCDMFLDRFYYAMPFRNLGVFSILLAGVAGYLSGLVRERRAAVFVWVTGFVPFFCAAIALASSWDPAWAASSRLIYVWESLFGPNCSSQECLNTVLTDVCLGLLAYSIGAKLGLIWAQKRRSKSEN